MSVTDPVGRTVLRAPATGSIGKMGRPTARLSVHSLAMLAVLETAGILGIPVVHT